MSARSDETIRLPDGALLDSLLDLESTTALEDLLAGALIDPLRDFVSRPKKGIRGEMVRIGFALAPSHRDYPERETCCPRLAEVLELLHAGSLVVDDIQDGSTVRRGARSLHELYGVPLALNAGNWLYFWPLRNIEELDLPADVRIRLYQECHSTMLRAHFGQAIDIGTPVTSLEQERIPEVCLATLQLKTGALMSLAMKLGAILGGVERDRLRAIDRFGHQFGVALQMFDDIGNLASNKNSEKRFEDLRNSRPGFVWSVAAQTMSKRDFETFRELAKGLPLSEGELLDHVTRTGLLDAARAKASAYLDDAFEKLETAVRPEPSLVTRLKRLQQELSSAYD